jgi:hypothetical protein
MIEDLFITQPILTRSGSSYHPSLLQKGVPTGNVIGVQKVGQVIRLLNVEPVLRHPFTSDVSP